MTRIILHGYLGQMGSAIRETAAKSNVYQIVAGVDALPPPAAMPFPTYTNITDCDMPADVLVDFSTAAAVPKVLDYASGRTLPVVVCTTGLTDETIRQMAVCAEKTAVFRSANMSLGVNLMAAILQKAAAVLCDEGFDIEIIEQHHNQKTDAPSGTALLLADAINAALPRPLTPVYGRSPYGANTKRQSDEMGIHAIRGGSIVGKHTVLFAGQNEILTIAHAAQSRQVFAAGALKAAAFVRGKPPGLYSMGDMLCW